MVASGSRERLERVPAWCSEPAFGLTVVVAGTLAMDLGRRLFGWLVQLLFGPVVTTGVVLESTLFVSAAFVLVTIVYGGVGLGGTYAYLTAREFHPGFVVAVPDREATQWLARLVAVVPVVVGLGALAELIASSGRAGWEAPSAFVVVGASSTLPGARVLSPPLAGSIALAVLAVVVGPALGALFHGVLQNSLRRVAPPAVAVSGTALAVAVLANGTDPIGIAGVVAVAAAAGYVYDRTDNLVVPMVAYLVLNAVTQTTALLIILSARGVS